MDLRRACETLTEIEAEVSVDALILDGLRIWPLLRMQIWHHLLHERGTARSLDARRPLRALRRLGWGLRLADPDPLPEPVARALEPADLLFLSRPEDHTDTRAGAALDRFLDPLLHTARAQASVTKVEFGDPDVPRPIRWEITRFLRPARACGRIDLRRLDLAPLRRTLARRIPGLRLEAGAIAEQLLRVRACERVLAAALERIRPRAALMVCYYADASMALTLACRRLGIPTVDVQHGKQGRFEGSYSHWTRVPDEGYALLPDWFWVWGEESRENLERWFAPGRSAHRVVVGGNRWVGWWKEGRVVEALDEGLAARIRAADRTVLVSLQPLDEPLPPLLRATLAASPPGWLWLIRLHPHQRPQLAHLRARLARLGRFDHEIEAATHAPLFALLKQSDHHVTCWSSVAHDALAFDVPTTLIDPDARALYERDLRENRFGYAETPAALLAAVRRSARPSVETRPYIEWSAERANAALATILASTRPSTPRAGASGGESG